MIKYASRPIMHHLHDRFARLYGQHRAMQCMERLEMLVGRYGIGLEDRPSYQYWDQADSLLITYGDMISAPGKSPLRALKDFADNNLRGMVSTVHILPFFPYSSDDGFSIIDYREVDPDLGTWIDVSRISEYFSLMFDLVLNHVSRRSEWFSDYVSGIAPACNYFIEMDPDTDLSQVVRPRSLPLLTKTQTRTGERYLWTTFSEDQIDLDFANPDVLFEFLDILFFYISKGARIIRLDAIAYLWKKIETSCIHLPETHEVVKIFRDVLNLVAPDVSLLTETNVPHEENISYFGDRDEAHVVYQFPLPPLILHTLISGNAEHLTRWASELPPPPEGCTFLNFTASHDGVGVRPLEGIASKDDLDRIVQRVKDQGGKVSTRRQPDGTDTPYELNITFFDACGVPGEDPQMKIGRFLCSQTIPLVLQGIPAIYFNSLIAGPNFTAGVEQTQRARTINRQKWSEEELYLRLNDPGSTTATVFNAYRHLLHLRAQQPAFSPSATQAVHNYGPNFFVVERHSEEANQTIVSISNITGEPQQLELHHKIPALEGRDTWTDLISDSRVGNADRILALEPYQTLWLQI